MTKTPFFKHYFINFLLFNLLFLGLQFVYMYLPSGSFIKAIPLPLAVYLQLAAALLIQLFLYLLLSLIQTALLWGLTNYYSDKKSLECWQLIIFILSISTILAANCYFFPLSAFSRLFLPEIPLTLFKILLVFSLFALGLLSLNALWRGYLLQPIFMTCSILGLIFILCFFPAEAPRQTREKTDKLPPNIILIGIDSLSPERVSQASTPNIAKFIKQSVQFKETITPLARTYPAWATILTGLYPLHHQARYNLMPADSVKSAESIGWTLQKMGYQTVYATDDRRFNSINGDFGFQEIIGPVLGVNDILLGTFNDFPLSNLLINLRLSQWLFPYNYMNRASHFSYYPSTFDRALQRFIQNKTKAPLFMAVHFTLPHWPYAWAESTPEEIKDEYEVRERNAPYEAAIHRADQQIGLLLQELEQANLLANSMIILLSDHGEALYEVGSRHTASKFYQGKGESKLADYFKRKTSTTLEISTGHGSDLLSPSQFHCLFAVKIFQQNKRITPHEIISTRVALIDIAPTIYDFLKLPFKKNFDGISLFNTILNKVPPPTNRAFMLESGELPNQIVSRKRAQMLGKLLFFVNPKNNQLEIRKDRLAILDALKLYAIIEGDWIVALYPDDYHYLTVTLHLKDGKWTDEIDSDFVKTSPEKEMLQKLLKFYQKELSSYPKSKLRPDLIE